MFSSIRGGLNEGVALRWRLIIRCWPPGLVIFGRWAGTVW